MHKQSFRNGDSIDSIGLGTWKSEPGEVERAVEVALEAGYRHIDCAAIYRNEAEIGHALARVFARGSIRREDVDMPSASGRTLSAPALISLPMTCSASPVWINTIATSAATSSAAPAGSAAISLTIDH